MFWRCEMTTVYFFEIPSDFNIKNYSFIDSFSSEQLNSKKNTPQNKYLSSLLAKIIVKKVALKTLNANICDISIDYGDFGKPYLKNHPNFHFNISHCKNAVAVAFSNSPVGIDIEKISTKKEKVAKRYFSFKENEYINKSANSDTAFYEIWTKKEAYFKRNGTGINADFSKISVLSEQIAKQIHTFKNNSFIISLCGEDIENFELNIINKDFFK